MARLYCVCGVKHCQQCHSMPPAHPTVYPAKMWCRFMLRQALYSGVDAGGTRFRVAAADHFPRGKPMSEADRKRGSGNTAFPMNRRTFVGASIAVTGAAVASAPLLAGCAGTESHDQSNDVHVRINGEPHDITVDNRTSLLD